MRVAANHSKVDTLKTVSVIAKKIVFRFLFFVFFALCRANAIAN